MIEVVSQTNSVTSPSSNKLGTIKVDSRLKLDEKVIPRDLRTHNPMFQR